MCSKFSGQYATNLAHASTGRSMNQQLVRQFKDINDNLNNLQIIETESHINLSKDGGDNFKPEDYKPTQSKYSTSISAEELISSGYIPVLSSKHGEKYIVLADIYKALSSRLESRGDQELRAAIQDVQNQASKIISYLTKSDQTIEKILSSGLKQEIKQMKNLAKVVKFADIKHNALAFILLMNFAISLAAKFLENKAKFENNRSAPPNIFINNQNEQAELFNLAEFIILCFFDLSDKVEGDLTKLQRYFKEDFLYYNSMYFHFLKLCIELIKGNKISDSLHFNPAKRTSKYSFAINLIDIIGPMQLQYLDLSNANKVKVYTQIEVDQDNTELVLPISSLNIIEKFNKNKKYYLLSPLKFSYNLPENNLL